MRWVTIFFFLRSGYPCQMLMESVFLACGQLYCYLTPFLYLSICTSLSLYLSISPPFPYHITHCFTSAVQFLSAPPPTPLLLLLLSIALSSACLDSLHSLFCLHSYVIHSSRDPYPPAAVVWNRSVHASEPTLTQGGWKPLIFSYSRG